MNFHAGSSVNVCYTLINEICGGSFFISNETSVNGWHLEVKLLECWPVPELQCQNFLQLV